MISAYQALRYTCNTPPPFPRPPRPHEFLTLAMLRYIIELNPKKTGGGGLKGPPLDTSRDYSATRKALAATLYDFFLSSFPHIFDTKICDARGYGSEVT